MKWFLLAFVLSAACRGERPPEEISTIELDRARGTVSTFKKTLVGELTSAMGKGIPVAIETCQVRAPEIASALSRDGVTVGRATRQARNPANRAAGWQSEAITHFEGLRDRGESLSGARFSRVLPGGQVAYAEPLVVAELCASCHGKKLAPEVASTLAARYPTDEATGYAIGDLRGVVWVELARR